VGHAAMGVQKAGQVIREPYRRVEVEHIGVRPVAHVDR